MVKGHGRGITGPALWHRRNPDYDLPRFGPSPAVTLFQLSGLIVLPLVGTLLFRWSGRMEFLGVCWVVSHPSSLARLPLVAYMAAAISTASIGFCWALAGPSWARSPRRAAKWEGAPARGPPRLEAAVAAGLVLALASSSPSHPPVLECMEELRSALDYASTKSTDYRVFNNLAQVRMQQKRWDEAERC